jgi:unsaturated rhamnogalacturonyl hydrolase
MSKRAVKNLWLILTCYSLLICQGWCESSALTPDASFSSGNRRQADEIQAQSLQSESDWLVLLANSIIQFRSNPASWSWEWGEGVLMYGLWQAYEATANPAYYTYIKSYVDHYVPQNGNITAHIDNVAYVNKVSPAILLTCLYQKTSDTRYLTAAHIVADYIQGTVRRVSNGALAHIFEDELWIDSLFMACIFLIRYAEITGDTSYLDEAVNQVLWHAQYLFDSTSHLFYHGWDENGSASWADPVTHRSPCFWGRGNGWAVATLSELIEALPADHESRNTLIELFNNIIRKLESIQEPGTGLWYTVVDRGGSSGNYLETSASALYVYGIEKGIEGGYLASDNSVYSRQGNTGLNSRVYIQSWNGEVIVHGISQGTTVGNYSHYTNIPLGNNTVWGLGAFLMAKKYFRPGAHRPKPVTGIEISIDGNNPVIHWQPVNLDVYDYPANISNHRIYRSTCPDFHCEDLDSVDIISSDHFLDSEIHVTNSPYRVLFYKVCAIDNRDRKSGPSEIVGIYKTNLSTSSSTRFNFISLPFAEEDISDAHTLTDAIPSCNSAAYWSAVYQGFYQYIGAIPSSNFDVAAHGVYFVNVNRDTFYLNHGEYEVPAYNLVSVGASTHFNAIMLPFHKQDIERASELMADIGSCNSVVKWDVATQGFVQYNPTLPESDFPVQVGGAYLVHVTENSIWPETGSSAGNPAKQPPDKTLNGEFCSHAPHLVIGRSSGLEGSIRKTGLRAFIASRSDEIIAADSPGCKILSSGWMIQCASFPSGWKEGEIVRIEAADEYGNVQYYEATLTWNPADEAIPAQTEEPSRQPGTTRLHANYPNPFNPVTRVPYEIESSGPVRIRVLDVTGRMILTLWDHERAAGKYEAVWDGTDDGGHSVSSGVYLIELSASGQTCRQKVLLVR